MLAFREDPGLERLRAALLDTAHTAHRSVSQASEVIARSGVHKPARPKATAALHLAERGAHALRTRSSVVYRIAQFGAFSLRSLWHRRWGFGGLAVLAVAVPLALAFLADDTSTSRALLALSAVVAAGLVVLLAGLFLERMLRRLHKASEEHSKSMFKKLRNELRQEFLDTNFSNDVVSVLRAITPLLAMRNTENRRIGAEQEHGHALLMALLVDEQLKSPGLLQDKVLVEIGSTRERGVSQGSSEKLAIFSSMFGMRFITADMDPDNTRNVQRRLKYLNPTAEAINEKGQSFIKSLSCSVNYLYLDAFDIEHGKHSTERKQRYRKILNSEISNESCWKMHEACAEAILHKMPKGGLVIIDDTWSDQQGEFHGKGKLAVPLLLRHGFDIVQMTPRVIALRRNQEADVSRTNDVRSVMLEIASAQDNP